MKPKLFFVIPELDKKTTSHYWHVYELLQRVGEKIEVVLFAETGHSLPPKRSLKGIYLQNYRFLPLKILERVIFFVKYSRNGYKQFYIHQSIFSSILAATLGKILGFKTYFWHCGMVHLYEKEDGRRNWLFRLNLKLVDYLVTAHEGMAKYYQEHFSVPKDKIKIFPGWVNIERFQIVNKKTIKSLRRKFQLENKKVILFVHWLSARKGSRLLPDIIKTTIEKYSNAVFLIIGDGPDRFWLRERLEKMNLLPYVRFADKISNREIPPYFNLADIFIMPSREEEMGRVQLEALAAGKPVVAFATIGSNFFLRNETPENLIKQGNIKGFADRVTQILDKSNYRGGREKHIASKYSLISASRKFLSLLKD